MSQLSKQHRTHSGFALIVCPDWGYVGHWHDLLADEVDSPGEAHANALARRILSSETIDQNELLEWATEANELFELLAGNEPTSRMGMLIQRVLDDRRNPDRLLPHIIRNEAPAYMIGNAESRYHFLGANYAVLAGAHTVFFDGHSDCAGVAARCEGLYHYDQFDLQRQMIRRGAQQFANLLAFNSGQDTRLIADYARFDENGTVISVEPIITVGAVAPGMLQLH